MFRKMAIRFIEDLEGSATEFLAIAGVVGVMLIPAAQEYRDALVDMFFYLADLIASLL